MKYRPLVLVIMDGVGLSSEKDGNAVALAKLPNLRAISQHYPGTALQAAGLTVGVPWGDVGNSEVGHLAIGSGLVVYQDLPRINQSIKDGSFYKNKILLDAIGKAQENNGTLHLVGLVSNGGVHAHIDHLFALLQLASQEGFKNPVYIHMITDGRDAPTKSAPAFLKKLQDQMQTLGMGVVATVSGRYYAMDRDQRWERTQQAYDAIVSAQGKKATTAEEAIQRSYTAEKTDEFIEPTVIGEYVGMQKGDSVIFCNFRADRARQLTQLFLKEKPTPLVTMTQYDASLQAPMIFPPQIVQEPIAKIISDAGLKQLHVAETEKYAHITYFLNGGTEKEFAGEERVLIPSPKVANYDKKPEMSAREITKECVTAIGAKKYDFIVINFANGDMVGHTGNLDATIEAMQVVDTCVGKIVEAALKAGSAVLITADHGNCEEMIKKQTGEIDTEHSTNPVPFWFVAPDNKREEPATQTDIIVGGLLPDVAPTILAILNLPSPPEMTGASLLNSIGFQPLP